MPARPEPAIEWEPGARAKLPRLQEAKRALALARQELVPSWRETAAPHQLPPEGDWRIWLFLGGRGAGKTHAGANTLAESALAEPAGEWLVAAPTFRDCRFTCIEGPAGLLKALGAHVVHYAASTGQIILDNGAKIFAISADKPDRFRGGNYRGAWCDELGAWVSRDTWDQLFMATREGNARKIITTTPRPTLLVRELLKQATVTRGTTYDNPHLSAEFVKEAEQRYAGTRLGRQELLAELLEDVEGALWNLAMFDEQRITKADLPTLTRVVVGVDPAVTTGEHSDETGIVAAGISADGQFYVLEDASIRQGLADCARHVLACSERNKADRVIGEVNNGGDLVEHTLRAYDRDMAYTKVSASRGKRVRAEPVAALYEQGRVHHVGGFATLEDQMASWAPDSANSPDRLDALVWAITALMQQRKGRRMTFAGRDTGPPVEQLVTVA